MDSFRCKDYDGLIGMFVEAIYKFNTTYDELRHLKKYVFVESNGRYDGGAFVSAYKNLDIKWLPRVGRLCFAGERQKYGITKTGPNSIAYIKETAIALAMNKIKFSNTFGENVASKKLMSKLRTQLEAFPTVKTNEYKKLKAIGSIQDDALITLMMSVYWYKETLINGRRLFEKWNSL